MSELKARQAENSVAARVDGKAAATTDLGNQLASGQRVYRTVWADDFAKFKADPKYRPVEYGGEAGDASVKAAATGTTTEQAAAVKADVPEPGTYKVSPGVAEPRGAWVVDADDYQKFVAAAGRNQRRRQNRHQLRRFFRKRHKHACSTFC
jgi:hypothetical protein